MSLGNENEFQKNTFNINLNYFVEAENFVNCTMKNKKEFFSKTIRIYL